MELKLNLNLNWKFCVYRVLYPHLPHLCAASRQARGITSEFLLGPGIYKLFRSDWGKSPEDAPENLGNLLRTDRKRAGICLVHPSVPGHARAPAAPERNLQTHGCPLLPWDRAVTCHLLPRAWQGSGALFPFPQDIPRALKEARPPPGSASLGRARGKSNGLEGRGQGSGG